MRFLLAFGCFLWAMTTLNAAEAAFTPPQAYPADRYEPDWMKNPFTLKTTPPPILKESWSKDLSLQGVSMSKDKSVLHVTIVNAKTHKRTTLDNVKPSADGLLVKSIEMRLNSKETTAVVEQNGEPATLKFDPALNKTLAAQNPAGTPGVPGMPGAPAMPRPVIPGSAVPPGGRPFTPGITPATTQAGGTSAPPVGAAPVGTAPNSNFANLTAFQRRRLNQLPNPVH